MKRAVLATVSAVVLAASLAGPADARAWHGGGGGWHGGGWNNGWHGGGHGYGAWPYIGGAILGLGVLGALAAPAYYPPPAYAYPPPAYPYGYAYPRPYPYYAPQPYYYGY